MRLEVVERFRACATTVLRLARCRAEAAENLGRERSAARTAHGSAAPLTAKPAWVDAAHLACGTRRRRRDAELRQPLPPRLAEPVRRPGRRQRGFDAGMRNTGLVQGLP